MKRAIRKIRGRGLCFVERKTRKRKRPKPTPAHPTHQPDSEGA